MNLYNYPIGHTYVITKKYISKIFFRGVNPFEENLIFLDRLLKQIDTWRSDFITWAMLYDCKGIYEGFSSRLSRISSTPLRNYSRIKYKV